MDLLSHVERRHPLYELCYPLFRLIHNRIYYRQFDIRGRGQLPPAGVPYIMVCNHQNGLNDAMAMLFAQNDRSRRPVFIARADIFSNAFTARILKLLRIMPAYRVRDTGVGSVNKNQAVFQHAAHILTQGGVIGIFPEAVAHATHQLNNFKKGFARIAFMAEEACDFQLGLQIVPVGLHYSNYEQAQSRLCLSFGKPFGLQNLKAVYQDNPQKAFTLLCQQAHDAVRPLMLDVPPDDYAMRDAACRMTESMLPDREQRPYYRVLDMLRKVADTPADTSRVQQWLDLLRAKALDGSLPTLPQTRQQMTNRFMQLLLLAIPALIGLLLFLPTWLIVRLTLQHVRTDVLRASFKIGIGTTVGSLNGLTAIVVGALAGGLPAAIVTACCCLPTAWACVRFHYSSRVYRQLRKVARQ